MKQFQISAAAALGSLVAVCGAPAQAQDTQVQLYGFVAPMVDHLRVSGAATAAPAQRPTLLAAGAYNGVGSNVTRMQSSTTNWGLRVKEDLGGGLSAFVQLESGFQADDGTLTGPPGNSRLFNRNTAVGLKGRLGTVFAGNWDTPIAWSHLGFTSGVRNPYAGDSSAIFLTPGFNIPHSATADNRTNSPTDATFNRRQGNSVQYWSPSLAGFSVRLAYALPEGDKTAANGAHYKPSVRGVGAEYANGPLLLRYVYQEHKDYFGLGWLGANTAANPDAPGSTASGSKDSDQRLIARWVLTPNWTLQGAFDRLSYRTDGVAAGAVERYSRSAWSAQGLWRQGAHGAWANVGQARDGSCATAGGGACNTEGLGARMWAAGYRYDFSKRTDVFASVYGIHNRDSGQYGPFPRAGAGIAPGARQSGLTLGMEHTF
jgi:predicted porin